MSHFGRIDTTAAFFLKIQACCQYWEFYLLQFKFLLFLLPAAASYTKQKISKAVFSRMKYFCEQWNLWNLISNGFVCLSGYSLIRWRADLSFFLGLRDLLPLHPMWICWNRQAKPAVPPQCREEFGIFTSFWALIFSRTVETSWLTYHLRQGLTLNRSKSHYVETDGQTDMVNLRSWVKTSGRVGSWVGLKNSLKRRWGEKKKSKIKHERVGTCCFSYFLRTQVFHGS